MGRSTTPISGVALVLVVGMIALLTVLVVAFLTGISSELQSASSYASGSDARGLADSAVNIVISQIQDATTTPTLAWASQPGMIRTYDNSGNAVTAYKLYSAASLRADGAYNPLTSLATEIPDSWAASPSVYVDLNRPVNSVYPIVDPAAVATAQSPSAGQSPQALDGSATPIQGCFINSPTKAIIKTSATQTNPIPLPVQWLYVLKDGTVASIDPITQVVVGAGTKLADGTVNTITGRIAFWADDETCKVNINTASEGTYWDRPWADGASGGYEHALASSLPLANEFQRYPGHPAMTSLSTIFPALDGEKTVDYNERIYGIVPRVVGGGSKSGTVTTAGTTIPLVADAQRLFASVDEFMFQGISPTQAGQTPLTRVANPSSPQESFKPADLKKALFFLTANSRAPDVNLFNKPRVTLWPLQANTANVADPADATNRNAEDKLIAFCSTIGTKPYYFQRYNTYDQTQNRANGPSQVPIPSSQSTTSDWTNVTRNQELYTYLQFLTSANIPGLGGSLGGSSGKYSLPVRDQILTEMVDYIRGSVNTFSTNVPPVYTYAPFPANSQGWVTGEGQVVPLEITQSGYTTKGFGRFPTITQAALVFYRTDPRYYQAKANASSSDPYTVMPSYAVLPSPLAVTTSNGDSPPGTPITMRAALILQPFHPTPGMPPWSANVRYSVSGLSGFTVNGNSMGFPDPATNLVDAQEGYYDVAPLSGFEAATEYWPTNKKQLPTTSVTVGSPTEDQFYPFCSGTITLPAGVTTFALSGGSITIKIYQGYATALNPGDLVQTIHMTFPAMPSLPVPHVSFSLGTVTTQGDPNYGKPTISSDNSDANHNPNYIDFNGRMNDPGVDQDYQHNIRNYIRPLDTVRSVQARYLGPALGDYRLIAGLAEVPDTYFEAHGQKDYPTDGIYYSGATQLIHSLRFYGGVGNEQTGKSNGFYAGSGFTTGTSLHGQLTPRNINPLDMNISGGVRPNRAPVAPQGLVGAWQDESASGVGTRLGDWDTGPGIIVDGPFVNKADEGNANTGYYQYGAYTTAGNIVETGASFSPNRQIASAVAFGSLPTGIDPSNPANTRPWQTLLFCANPAANPITPTASTVHPGFGTPLTGSALGPAAAPPYSIPPDHAFLDLFTMPIVEPYAISEPFSTAGKVNMNYQMVPFTYLTRDTALRAVLKGTNITAINNTLGQNYKSGTGYNVDSQLTNTDPPCFRYTIDPDELNGTLCGFENRFATGDIFRSASEICNIYLVPLASAGNSADAAGPSITGSRAYSTMARWWQGTTNTNTLSGMKLTGDNLREAPYASVYPRLTTKSNTYTVHVIAQSVKKSILTPANKFVDGSDQVTGEYRGSFVVQRYLDPNSDSLVLADGKTVGTETDPNSMVGPYKFRVVSTKRFAP